MNFINMPDLPNKLSFKLKKSGKIIVKSKRVKVATVIVNDVEEPAIYISYLHVKKKYRSQGYGTIILKWIIDKAKDLECEGISLYVAVSNRKAIRFYRRLGFFISCKANGKVESHHLMTLKL